jgi:serine/threonine protein kinase
MILGQGSYGKVIIRPDRSNQAVKQYSRVSHLVQEYCALYYLRDCPHIVKPVGFSLANMELYMELYDMSLRQWMNHHSGKLFETEGQSIIKDVVYGLIELHERGLAHGDLKPGNILVKRENGKYEAVLGDCGFVSVAKYAKVEKTAPIYRDPVIEHDLAHDMYSLGICLLEMMGEVYISKQVSYGVLQDVIRDKVENIKYRKLLRLLLNENRARRPTAKQVLKYLYNEEYYSNFRSDIPSDSLSPVSEEYVGVYKYMKSKCYKYEIHRGKVGYWALIQYIERNHINKEYYQLYADLTLFILAAVFGTSKYCLQSFKELSRLKYSIPHLHTICADLLEDTSFIQLLLNKGTL